MYRHPKLSLVTLRWIWFALAPGQSTILYILLQKTGEVVSYAELNEVIGVKGSRVPLKGHIQRLRKKLGQYGYCITTVYGKGLVLQRILEPMVSDE